MKFVGVLAFIPVLAIATKQWKYSEDPNAKAGVAVGVGATSLNGVDMAASAMGDNNQGAEIGVYLDEMWNKDSVDSLMVLDAAIMSTGEIISPGVGDLIYSNSSKPPYYRLELEYFVMSQSANVIESTGSFALVGSFEKKSKDAETINGVMIMSPQGKIEGVYDINVPSTNYARYGAFPTSDTWYITAGMWPTDDEEVDELKKNGKKRLTRQLTLNGNKEVEFNPSPKPKNKTTFTDGDTGYYMSISKTIDGGKTFTTVFSSPQNSYYYPNGVSCWDENHCVVAAEGHDEDGNPLVFAFLSEDGGNTWSNTITADQTSERSCIHDCFTRIWDAGWILPDVGGLVDAAGLANQRHHLARNLPLTERNRWQAADREAAQQQHVVCVLLGRPQESS